MARFAGIEVSENKTLGWSWPLFNLRIDGIEAYYDYSDFPTVNRPDVADKTIKRTYISSNRRMLPKLICGANVSFLDWENRPVESASPGDVILNCQLLPDTCTEPVMSARERRLLARNLLIGAFPQLDCVHYWPAEFFERALECLCSVHIPGAWEHCLDRGQAQLMGMGVCTVSPDIWTCAISKRPQPWEHYVPIKDNYSDLVRNIQWCVDNHDEVVLIGQRAKVWFDAHETPAVVWKYIMERLQ